MLSTEIVEQIRQGKREGLSLKTLAIKFHCCKSTVSLYCRDLFYHPRRKYRSEYEARRIPFIRRKDLPRKKYPHSKARKLYPCVVCGYLIRRTNCLCIRCYTLKRAEEAVASQGKKLADKEQQEKKRKERELKRFPPLLIEDCLISPNNRHHWLIDSKDYARCGYCGKEKDMARLSLPMRL